MVPSRNAGEKKAGNSREIRKSHRLYATAFSSEDHAVLLAMLL